MKILLLNPWVTDFFELGYWTKPIGLLYVASFLFERGHSVRLIDCMDRFQDGKGWNLTVPNPFPNRSAKIRFEDIEKPAPLRKYDFTFRRHGIPVELFRSLAIDGPRPDIVLVTSVMTYWYHGAFEAISLVRDIFPDVPIVLGGIYATLCTEHARENSGADAVVTEFLPSRIIDAVESIGGKRGNGRVVNDHFSEWPDPLWDLYDQLPATVTMTSLGCPMRCTVCASHILCRNRYERRAPSDAATSIIKLAARGVKGIGFWDDALLIDAEHYAIPMFDELAQAGAPVRLRTPNGVHISKITPELSRIMKKAGVYSITLSIETISKARMKSFSSKTTLEQFRQAVDMLFGAGYRPGQLLAYILFGLPGQTVEEAVDTKEFVSSLGVKPEVLVFTPVPGTVEFKRAVKAGMIDANSDPVLQNNKLTAINFFEKNVDKREKFKQLFDIDTLSAKYGR